MSAYYSFAHSFRNESKNYLESKHSDFFKLSFASRARLVFNCQSKTIIFKKNVQIPKHQDQLQGKAPVFKLLQHKGHKPNVESPAPVGPLY